jgi:hypothetical protein
MHLLLHVTAPRQVAAATAATAAVVLWALFATTATTLTGCKSATDAALPVAQAAGGLAPCTAAGQAQCVKCDGSRDGVCTETEAALVRYDIAKRHVFAAGPERSDPAKAYAKEACYECAMHSGCLDDRLFNDDGHECHDHADAGVSAAQCTQALSCMLQSGCARSTISPCYCGDAGIMACHSTPAPAGGPCAQAIAAGLSFDKSDGVNVTSHLTDTSRASGVASQILQCAHSNSCTSCF